MKWKRYRDKQGKGWRESRLEFKEGRERPGLGHVHFRQSPGIADGRTSAHIRVRRLHLEKRGQD